MNNLNSEVYDLIPPIIGQGNDWSLFEDEVEKRFESRNPESYTMPVSIVIPVYNRKEKLSKTIAALTHQTYPLNLMEIVVADDGSSDNPEELLDIFSSYFEISYLCQEDLGYRLSEIRNKGIKKSSHEQIIILDCDMLPEPTLVEEYMKYAHVSQKCVLVGGRRYVNTDNLSYQNILEDIGNALALPSLRTDTGEIPDKDQPPSEDWRYGIYRSTNNLKNSKYPFRAFCGGNVCFHKTLIQVVGGFDEDFTAWGAEDTEFGFRVYNHGFWFIPVQGANALHQEPPNGSNETDRDAGKQITQPLLIEKCPAFYRKMEKDRIYQIPKVSVYIPAYNAINFIEEAIESALNQTYTDLEIVIVNDGSTDGTGELLDELYGMNPRISIIHQENAGISAATNKAINNCKGEYVLQLDSDDALLPIAAEMLVNVLDKNDIGFVYGDAYLTDITGKVFGRAYSWSMYDRYKLLDGMMIHHPRMFRMRDFKKTTGFDESLSNAVDYDFFLKLSGITQGYHLQTPLYLYRQHNTNTSKVNVGAQDKNNHQCIISAFDRMGLQNRVELKPDLNHNRKMLKDLFQNPADFRLNLSYIYQMHGIEEKKNCMKAIWEVKKLVCPEMLTRQQNLEITNKRFVRIGSYGSPKVATSVSSKIDKQYDVISNIFSVQNKTSVSYFVEVPAPNNDRLSLELKREIVEKHNWKAEVISKPQFRNIIATNVDTRSHVAEYSELCSKDKIPVEGKKFGKNYNPKEFWKLEGHRLIFSWKKEQVFFEMPEDWAIKNTHTDLFRLAHYVLVAPWDSSVLKGWKPSRKPGWRPGLAFSGGVDSTAALALMPKSTILIYNQRSRIEGQLNHTNALRFFDALTKKEHREVFRIKSNHETLRKRDGKMAGFSTDYACAVQVILLADYFGLDSIGTGMPLENSYLWHGYRYRDFSESRFWKHNSEIFSNVGLDIYQPVAGCSEIINMKIVQANNWEGWAQSCLRSKKPGEVCGKCWKCFRKNSLLGTPFKLAGEIETFLSTRPLKQTASTIYSIQKGGVSQNGTRVLDKYPDLKPLAELDFEFLTRYYLPANALLPSRYRNFTSKMLSKYAKPMTKPDIDFLQSIDFYPEN